MEYEPEFPLPAGREREAVTQYFRLEEEFMPAQNYLVSDRNQQIRKFAVSTVARYSKDETSGAFTPYLAMNYFDRFLSRHPLPNIQADDKENVRLLVVCCMTLASKIRNRTFSVTHFLGSKLLDIPSEKILKLEFSILNGLNWRMRSITAFCFLNHYYPAFKRLGGFKRRSINEIIVLSQGEDFFTRQKPSVIAMSSFLVAARIAYPTTELSVGESEKPCFDELLDLCIKKNIQIERAHSRFVASSIAPATGEEQAAEFAPTKRSKPIPIPGTSGKEASSDSENVLAAEEVVSSFENFSAAAESTSSSEKVFAVEDAAASASGIVRAAEKVAASTSEIVRAAKEVVASVSEIVPAEEATPKKLWNFDLRWIVLGEESEVVIPPLEIQGTPAASSTTITRDVGNNINGDTSDPFNICHCVCNPPPNMLNHCNMM